MPSVTCHRLHAFGYTLLAVGYTPFLFQVTACGRGGNLDGAMSLLETMRSAGVPPNCYTYNSAIHACARKVYTVHMSRCARS